MDACPKRRQDRESPIAQLIAESFDNDRAVVGHGTGCLRLIGQIVHKVVGGQLVEPRALMQPRRGLLALQRRQLAHRLAHRSSDFDRTTHRIAVPERDSPRLTRCQRDHDLGRRDVGNPPGARTEHERLAGPHLVDHLLIQLADPLAVVEQIHREEAPIGDGPATDGNFVPCPARNHVRRRSEA